MEFEKNRKIAYFNQVKVIFKYFEVLKNIIILNLFSNQLHEETLWLNSESIPT